MSSHSRSWVQFLSWTQIFSALSRTHIMLISSLSTFKVPNVANNDAEVPDVHRVDNAINCINCYPVDKSYTKFTIHWIVIHPMDSTLSTLWTTGARTLMSCWYCQTSHSLSFAQHSHELRSLVVIFLMWLAIAGTEEEQMLKNCQPPSPKSDYDGSDYLADDESSACSSPSHSELSDTEHEDHSQDTISMFRTCSSPWLCIPFKIVPPLANTSKKSNYCFDNCKLWKRMLMLLCFCHCLIL